jgi:hypothetical protein
LEGDFFDGDGDGDGARRGMPDAAGFLLHMHPAQLNDPNSQAIRSGKRRRNSGSIRTKKSSNCGGDFAAAPKIGAPLPLLSSHQGLGCGLPPTSIESSRNRACL